MRYIKKIMNNKTKVNINHKMIAKINNTNIIMKFRIQKIKMSKIIKMNWRTTYMTKPIMNKMNNINKIYKKKILKISIKKKMKKTMNKILKKTIASIALL